MTQAAASLALPRAFAREPARARPPQPAELDPEQLATLLRVPPWICANVDASRWSRGRRLAWRLRYWTWSP